MSTTSYYYLHEYFKYVNNSNTKIASWVRTIVVWKLCTMGRCVSPRIGVG
ncbi:MAG: hypothetical protein ACOC56_04505 [Atribacterota bacterium]